ncbi:NAD(P)-dependent oxidoreductase [Rheinheimera sp. 1928-s]|uniref:NAD-dependent epimerase/dehydratase family protein n=1 Tax=Rheinheimera sp. 1928-s TaxID=3033803 RepID=UPI002635A3F6|nr:NAD(P)-dependent oxidoreductase [Rheinheimera sp. 1928-s]MDF3125823.1 NAD(P)-dependent oxidoreductase [Rheinheimera sp. 1928-s]
MKNLLLVGGSGFVGQALHRYYQQLGWKVYTLGRRQDDDFAVSSIDSLILNIQIHRLILAAAVNETQIQQDLQLSYQVNVVLTRQVVELCRRSSIPELVYFSTFHVYGRSSGELDELSLVAPKNDYGLTHYLSERIVLDLASYGGYQPLILRPTNIYGLPPQLSDFYRWSLVPFEFVQSAVLKGKIEIRSSGQQLRNFVSVDDVVRATELVGQVQVLNVFGLNTLSIVEFAQLVAKVLPELNCQIKTVPDSHPSQSTTLVVRSSYEQYQPKGNLADFIRQFAQMVLNHG